MTKLKMKRLDMIALERDVEIIDRAAHNLGVSRTRYMVRAALNQARRDARRALAESCNE